MAFNKKSPVKVTKRLSSDDESDLGASPSESESSVSSKSSTHSLKIVISSENDTPLSKKRGKKKTHVRRTRSQTSAPVKVTETPVDTTPKKRNSTDKSMDDSASKNKKRRTKSDRNCRAGIAKPTTKKNIAIPNEVVVEAFDRLLEEKSHDLTGTNIRNLIRSVFRDKSVQKIVNETRGEDDSSDDEVNLDPKLTRAKTKELLENPTHVDQSGKKIWQIMFASPAKQKPEPENILQLHLSEDSSGEDYVPRSNELHQSDDEGSSLASQSDLGSPASAAAASPKKRRLAAAANDNLSSDMVFKTPPPKPKADDGISLRTRSKLPLTDTSLEALENQFIPPDITTDMYDWGESDTDNEYLGFLRSYRTDNNHDDQEEGDSDFNYMGDDDIVQDNEELRQDRAVKISKKELDLLMAELFESTLGSEDEGSSLNFFDLGNPEPTSEQGHQVVVEDVLGSMASSVSDNCQSPMKHNPPLNNESHSPTQQQLCEILTVSTSAQIDRAVLFPAVSIEILRHQLRQHVQLLTQVYVLTCDDTNDGIAGDTKRLICNLKELKDEASGATVFDVYNLDAAFEIVTSWPLTAKQPIKKKILEERYTGDDWSSILGGISRNVVKLFAHSRAFIYPKLLPNSYHPRKGSTPVHHNKLSRCEEAIVYHMSQYGDVAGLSHSRTATFIKNRILPNWPINQIFHKLKNLVKESSSGKRRELQEIYEQIKKTEKTETTEWNPDCVVPLNQVDHINFHPVWQEIFFLFKNNISKASKKNTKPKGTKRTKLSNNDSISRDTDLTVNQYVGSATEANTECVEAFNFICFDGQQQGTVLIPKYAIMAPGCTSLSENRVRSIGAGSPKSPNALPNATDGHRDKENQETETMVKEKETHDEPGKCKKAPKKNQHNNNGLFVESKLLEERKQKRKPKKKQPQGQPSKQTRKQNNRGDETKKQKWKGNLETVHMELEPENSVETDRVGELEPFAEKVEQQTNEYDDGVENYIISEDDNVETDVEEVIPNNLHYLESRRFVHILRSFTKVVKLYKSNTKYDMLVSLPSEHDKGLEVLIEHKAEKNHQFVAFMMSPPVLNAVVFEHKLFSSSQMNSANNDVNRKYRQTNGGDTTNTNSKRDNTNEPSDSKHGERSRQSNDDCSAGGGSCGSEAPGPGEGDGDDDEDEKFNDDGTEDDKDDMDEVKEDETDDEKDDLLESKNEIEDNIPSTSKGFGRYNKRWKRSTANGQKNRCIRRYKVGAISKLNFQMQYNIQEEVYTALTQSFIEKLQSVSEAQCPAIFPSFIQLLSEYEEAIQPELVVEIKAKARTVLKDFPDLFKEFEYICDSDFGVLSREQAATFESIRFVKLLDQWTEDCPQLRTKIIQKIKILKHDPNTTESMVIDKIEPYFQNNGPLLEAFKSMIESTYRPFTASTYDYEEIDLDNAPSNGDTAFEHVTLPDDSNVVATSTCPCGCHTSTIDPAMSSRSKHCNKCCLKFQDGKVYAVSGGRGMRAVDVEYVTADGVRLLYTGAACSRCGKRIRKDDNVSPKRADITGICHCTEPLKQSKDVTKGDSEPLAEVKETHCSELNDDDSGDVDDGIKNGTKNSDTASSARQVQKSDCSELPSNRSSDPNNISTSWSREEDITLLTTCREHDSISKTVQLLVPVMTNRTSEEIKQRLLYLIELIQASDSI